MSEIEQSVWETETEERRPVTRKLAPHLGLTREEMNWAALAHASIVLSLLMAIATSGLGALLGVAVPAIIWYAHRNRSDYVVEQARQATIFQLAGLVGILALGIGGAVMIVLAWIVTGLLSAILVGLLLIPVALLLTLVFVVVLAGLPIAMTAYGLYGALEASNGRPFRYRWAGDLVDRYVAHA